jgi:hypothetical protein
VNCAWQSARGIVLFALIGMAALILVLATVDEKPLPQAAASTSAQEDCSPNFFKLSSPSRRNSVVRIGSTTVVYNVLLLGCSSNLKQITGEQQRWIAHLVRASIAQMPEGIAAKAEEPAFRHRLLSQVGHGIGDHVVTDIYLNVLWVYEHQSPHGGQPIQNGHS